MNKLISSTTLFVIILLFSIITGCSDNSTSPVSDNISLYTFDGSEVTTELLDSLTIDTAKILLKDIKLNVENSSDSTNFKTGPFVMFLQLRGRINLLTTSMIPAGTYEKIKFEIHKPDPGETLIDPDFGDNNGRYSVVVKGTFNGQYFVYKSSQTFHQKLNFPTYISVLKDTYTNITLKAEPYKWFYNNGVYLNPSDPANANNIDNNIRDNVNNNFRCYLDNNKDGVPD